MRAPTVITLNPDGTQTVTQLKGASFQKERFVTPDVSDFKSMAASLTRLQKSVSDIGDTAAANPASECTIFANVPVGSSGAKCILVHGFGYAARWFVVRWRGASGGHSLVEDSTTNTAQLVLASYTAGTADILVM